MNSNDVFLELLPNIGALLLKIKDEFSRQLIISELKTIIATAKDDELILTLFFYNLALLDCYCAQEFKKNSALVTRDIVTDMLDELIQAEIESTQLVEDFTNFLNALNQIAISETDSKVDILHKLNAIDINARVKVGVFTQLDLISENIGENEESSSEDETTSSDSEEDFEDEVNTHSNQMLAEKKEAPNNQVSPYRFTDSKEICRLFAHFRLRSIAKPI